jgi:pimeloyl-ACP methyl ester carboxylesterase
MEIRRVHRRSVLSCVLAMMTLLVASSAFAQPAGSGQMCGDGTTFTVNLPGLPVLPLGFTAPHDSVTLPKGCRIYAIFVSGYERNKALDELTFYKLAKFVAENNGYVHYAWWNNFMKEYMAGSLHPVNVTVPILGTISNNPGGLLSVHASGFIPLDFLQVTTLTPKAIPEEDTQFQADAERVLQAIRAHNPDAVIIVAGHSMGGEAVARLGATTNVAIDLLAPIDPVGNRTRPVGMVTNRTYNWTRWRAAQQTWGGFRQADCIRIGPYPLPCKDFDSRIFHVEYHCAPNGVGPLLDSPPVIGSRAPLHCAGPWIDPGKRRAFRSNVKHLYHRWQKEALFPFDFGADERFTYAAVNTVLTSGVLIPTQMPLEKNALLESNRLKTCANPAMADPRDPTIACHPGDGHGEIVGFRGLTAAAGGAVPVGLKAQQWPSTAQGRREALIEMVTAPQPAPFKIATDPSAWRHEPLNPHLDMVAADMIRIVESILERAGGGGEEEDVIAPVTTAVLDPSANDAGWNNSDVTVSFSASDNTGGSGVKEIEFSLSGAQTGGATTPGDEAQAVITNEGETTVRYFARDVEGNVEVANQELVRLDKTPPLIASVTDVMPNAAGWHKTAVQVSFEASDTLSGVASVSAPVAVTAEGSGQEIIGTAEDKAGNQAAAAAALNIDLTLPNVTINAPSQGTVYLLNETVKAEYACADALSGIASCIGPVAAGATLPTGSVGDHTFAVAATDVADNHASQSHAYAVRYAFSGFMSPIGSGVNAVNGGQTVPVKFSLQDARGASVSRPSSVVSLMSAPSACDGSAPGPMTPAQSSGGLGLRADGQQLHFNWKTEKSWTGCRLLALTLADGATHKAVFRFK